MIEAAFTILCLILVACIADIALRYRVEQRRDREAEQYVATLRHKVMGK